jgi:phage baseplate assembly protein W
MAKTTSLAFPNMFDIATNQVGVIEDTDSVSNRTRLLILTEPTELYNNPDFGVGLQRHMWKYNNEAERGLVKDRITEQLRLHEPCVYPEKTQYTDGLLFSEADVQNSATNANRLALTVALQTVFKEEAKVELNSEE